MKTNLLFISFLISLCHFSFAQIGGKQSFSFLNLAQNTTVSSLGGVNVSSTHEDVSMMLHNPALMTNPNLHQKIALNYFSYWANIQQSSLAFQWHQKRFGHFGFGVQYLSYGEMDSYDNAGNPLGKFQAREYALSLSYAKKISHFSLGASLKWAGSVIGGYNANGFLVDFGGAFIHPKRDFKVGMTFRNIGFAVSNYAPSSNFVMPFDVQLGTSFKPQKMPVRFSITAQRLYRYDISYNNPNQLAQIDVNGNVIQPKISTSDKILRHFVIGTEFLFHKNFNVRFGYNMLIRREMILSNRKGMAGFSFGFLLKVKSLELAFSSTLTHINGGYSSFSLTLPLSSFLTKKEIKE